MTHLPRGSIVAHRPIGGGTWPQMGQELVTGIADKDVDST